MGAIEYSGPVCPRQGGGQLISDKDQLSGTTTYRGVSMRERLMLIKARHQVMLARQAWVESNQENDKGEWYE